MSALVSTNDVYVGVIQSPILGIDHISVVKYDNTTQTVIIIIESKHDLTKFII